VGAPGARPASPTSRRLGVAHPDRAEIAVLAAEGLTTPQIGERMFISKGTVKAHLAHIFKMLDVHNCTELTARAVRRGATS